jgi:hypothetical protein
MRHRQSLDFFLTLMVATDLSLAYTTDSAGNDDQHLGDLLEGPSLDGSSAVHGGLPAVYCNLLAGRDVPQLRPDGSADVPTDVPGRGLAAIAGTGATPVEADPGCLV